MKIVICYPPLRLEKGCPTLGQNRQFQYFKDPTYIYPVVPAQAATLLKNSGYEVIWLDCLAEEISYETFMETIRSEKPDLIVFETKTPVVKQLWNIINDLKNLTSENWQLKTILCGDHVTALPNESFQNCAVDFVLTGGDYDFLLLNLCDFIKKLEDKNQNVRYEELEAGIYYRQDSQIKNTGVFKLDHDLNMLPFIDRDLTKWQLYAYKNGNYKRVPGTYLMSGRDCWWGRCTFCSWPLLYPEFRSRKTENVLDEVGELISRYGVREIMDDTGTFPKGEWLRDFCLGMIARGYHKKIYLDSNMRFGALSAEDFSLMKKANFRLLLFGLESANQQTLDKLQKNVTVERVIQDCMLASRSGLYPHITIMFGYPWEDYTAALKTLRLGRWLLKKGYAYTMQATVVIPYPGSPLFQECRQQGWLKTLDWDDYDMKMPIMSSPIPEGKINGLVQGMYRISFHPEFVLRKLNSVKDIDDFAYVLRALKKVYGHIFDFAKSRHGN